MLTGCGRHAAGGRAGVAASGSTAAELRAARPGTAVGAAVPLQEYDHSLWNRGQIADALGLRKRAAACGQPRRYQVEAAIAGVDCEAPAWTATNWPQIVELYSMLMALDPSPVVALNRAIALGYVAGHA